MLRKNFPERRAVRKLEAMVRENARDKRSHHDQLTLLGVRPGSSTKEKARLWRAIGQA